MIQARAQEKVKSIALIFVQTLFAKQLKQKQKENKENGEQLITKLREEDEIQHQLHLLRHSWRKASLKEVSERKLVIGGWTDFAERRGWWPYVDVEIAQFKTSTAGFGKKTERVPLKFLGTVTIKSRKADIFYGVAEHGQAYQIGRYKIFKKPVKKTSVTPESWMVYDKEGGATKGCFAVIFEDSSGPEWVHRQLVGGVDLRSESGLIRTYKNKPSDWDWDTGKMCWSLIPYIPSVPLPEKPICTNTEKPFFSGSYHHFIAQFKHNAGNGTFQTCEGKGSLSLFWDGENAFKFISHRSN